MSDRVELQRIAGMVDLNRQRMVRIEEQMSRLETIMLEQGQVVRALRSVPPEGQIGGMVPLGAGVQLVVDLPADAGAVIDIGSGIQAERTRAQAADALEARQNEVGELLQRLHDEFDEAERTVRRLAVRFNESVEANDSAPASGVDGPTASESVDPAMPAGRTTDSTTVAPPTSEEDEDSNDGGKKGPRRGRRGSGFGGELTLDD